MNYYDDQLKNGNQFEEHVVKELQKKGITLTLTRTKLEQIEIGETYEGYEIKYDKKYSETHNLWIETEERTDITKEWVQSGINRNDNTIFYVIGDYSRIFVFNKATLKILSEKYEIQENNMKTSKGFLLSGSEAFRYAEEIIDSNELKNIHNILDNWM